MTAERIQIDHQSPGDAEGVIARAKIRVCRLPSCGAIFSQVRSGRGRPRGFCC